MMVDRGNAWQEAHLAAMTECLNERLLEIAELHQKNTVLFQRIGEEEELSSRMEQENAALKEKLQFCQGREEAFLQELHHMEKDLESARQKLEEAYRELGQEREHSGQAEQEILRLKEMVSRMEESRSWKITKPLRMLLWKVKGE